MSTDAATAAVDNAQEQKTKAKANGKSGRGRAAKAAYPVAEGTKLSEVPKDWSEDKYKLVPEADFQTVLLHREYMVWVYEQRTAQLNDEIAQLKAVPEEVQGDMSAAVGGLGKFASGLKNVLAACKAKLEEAKAGGDAKQIADAEAAYKKANDTLQERIQEALAAAGLA